MSVTRAQVVVALRRLMDVSPDVIPLKGWLHGCDDGRWHKGPFCETGPCSRRLEWADLARRVMTRCLAPRLLVFPCARCQGYTDTLRDGLCLTCKTRPWQNGYYRNPEEVQAWKP